MSLTIYKQTSQPSGSYTAVDVEALGIGDAKLSIGYSHPARFAFTVTANSHDLPFTFGTFLRVWDPDGTVDDTSSSQDSTNPLFEGFVAEMTPGADTNTVNVVCYDPTERSVRKVPLMNLPWSLVGGVPTPDDAAYPRVVFNVTQDNDDDYAFSIGQNLTLGGIIEQVLTDGYLPLYYINAAPGTGSTGGDTAFNADELGEATSDSLGWSGGLDFEPQEKVVAHSESIRSFIDRLTGQYDPTTKFLWQPGERKWRFIRVKAAPAITVTVNDPTAWHGAVLSMDIRRSIDGRYGAVKIVGPEGLEWRTAEWWTESSGANTLEPVSFGSTVGNTPDVGRCFHAFQITDPDFTRIANKGPYAISVPGPFAIWASTTYQIQTTLVETYVQTWSPSLQVRFPSSSAGNANWKTVSGARWDARSGYIWIGDGCLYRWAPADPTNRFEEPIGLRFIYPATTTPLSVREPSSGYEGTAYSVGGMEAEKIEYDEALAVGYSYGIPVTTPTRLARFDKLATQILSQVKDIVYAGGITLEGLQYDFARLNRRVNIAAKNDNGGALTTGWEAVGAIVTDVEYDFTDRTTTVQFSSDQLETIGMDPERLKSRLKIRPAQLMFFFSVSVAYSYHRSQNPLDMYSGLIQDKSIVGTTWFEWQDEFGELQ